MIIKTETDYKYALKLLDHFMTKAEDRDGEPLLHLINIFAEAIEQYENILESIKLYNKETDSTDLAVSIFRVLADQYGFTTTVVDYEAALARIEEIWDAEPNTPVGDERDSLVTLVSSYEDSINLFSDPAIMAQLIKSEKDSKTNNLIPLDKAF